MANMVSMARPTKSSLPATSPGAAAKRLDEAAQHVAVKCVGEVEGVGGVEVIDIDAMLDVEDRAAHDRIVGDGEGGLEARVGRGHFLELAADGEEAVVVAIVAVAGRAFALVDDGVDGAVGAGEVGERRTGPGSEASAGPIWEATSPTNSSASP